MSGIWTEIKAFFSNPIQYIYDPGYTIEYQTNELIKAGKTKEEITAILETELGMVKGGGALRQVYEGVTKTVEFVNKNFLWIVVVLVTLMAGYYFLSLRRLVK